MLPLPDWWSHACKQKAYFFFSLQGHQSVSFHFVHTLEAHSCSKGSLACDRTATQHKFTEPWHCRWLQGSRAGLSLPHCLPVPAVQSQPCQCHMRCSVPEKGTQPYTVPACNSQTFQNPEAPFTQAPRSLATSIRSIWSLSGLPWAKNLVWNSFSLQHFGLSASGAI